MAEYIESLARLAEKFGRLEGVGKKTAMRMAFSVLELDVEEAEDFARAILDAKEKIHLCPVCQNLTDREVCPICADEERDRSVICVVTDARTVLAMEKVREYRGTYHVLHGLISPMNGITPEQLHIGELIKRVNDDNVKEVIIATNPSVEGESTALLLEKLLHEQNPELKLTRLARGLPLGVDLSYADQITLSAALENRTDL